MNEENLPIEKTDQAPVPALQDKKRESKLDFQEQITDLIHTAGTIEITIIQREILYASVKDEQVEIRPDGLIYLPWMEYVSRLRDAFGVQWAIIPQGMPTAKGDYILWPFWLVIQGKIAGFAVGEQQYYANNPTMTYGDALEGSKSNALMRLCKGIGISLELWKPSFIRNWKQKYSESFPAIWPDGKPKLDKNGKQKVEWRKKGQEEVLNGNSEAGSEIEPEPTLFDSAIKHLDEKKNMHELKNSWTKHFKEWKEKLTPEEFVKLEIHKGALKEKFEKGTKSEGIS
jgi:hypothetical protein